MQRSKYRLIDIIFFVFSYVFFFLTVRIKDILLYTYIHTSTYYGKHIMYIYLLCTYICTSTICGKYILYIFLLYTYILQLIVENIHILYIL